MNVKFSPQVHRELRKLKKKDRLLTKKIEKPLSIFVQNPKHPCLRLHKLTGDLKSLWSISVTRSVRMVFIQEEEEVYFVDIGTHDEVYKK